MKRILVLVVAMAMIVVPSVFAQEDGRFKVGGEAEYSVVYESTEVGDADAVNMLKMGDGGRISLAVSASKELDNGAKVAAETRFDAKYDGVSQDYIRLKYMNGPLTVQMLKAARPGVMSKGLDKYVPEGPWYNCETTKERDVSFAYAGEGMTFTTTVNFRGSNNFALRPHVQMGLGAATVKAAVEYVRDFPQDMDADGPITSIYGGGVGVEANLGTISVGASGAYGVEAKTNAAGDDADDVSKMSAYAFSKINVGAGTLGLAGGYNLETSDSYAEDKNSVQGNVTFEFPNIMVPGLKLQGGVGYAMITDQNDVETKKTGGKFAVVYGF